MTTAAKRVEIISIKKVREGSILYADRNVSSPSSAVRLFKPFMEDSDREKFMVAYLNTKNEPVGIHTVSIGTVNASLVNPPEVLKGALLCNATFMILCHCHPSGTAIPSADDRKVTRRMVEVGELMGIKVIDHIIIGDGDAYFSFKDAQQRVW